MELQEALKKIEQLKNENVELRKMCEDLEKRLRIYENPHTPSSKRIIKEKEFKERGKPKKRGAPKGHKGRTRRKPTPNNFVNHTPQGCPKCRKTCIKITRKRIKTSEDVEMRKVVTKHKFYDCRCEGCGHGFTTGDRDLPRCGRFGPNIVTLWMMLHYVGCIPFDRLSKISGNLFKIDVTPATIHNAIYRSAKIFEPRYNRIKNRVVKAKTTGSDETSSPYNGEKHWLWNFTTSKESLSVIRNSRGSNVLEEIFGKYWDAILSSDCYSAYQRFESRESQKCWAHILRTGKDLAKNNKEGEWLYGELSRMYKYIVKVKDEKRENSPEVEIWMKRQITKISSWVSAEIESKAVRNLVLRMSKYLEDWFTCLKYEYVEPTNNATERDIRRNVIARKISGQHRSKLGQHSREIMMSVIMTMEKRDQNPFESVQNYIERYNSGARIS